MADYDAKLANRIKVAVCEYLLKVNREMQGPFVPPTAIDWLGDGLTAAVLRESERVQAALADVTQEDLDRLIAIADLMDDNVPIPPLPGRAGSLRVCWHALREAKREESS